MRRGQSRDLPDSTRVWHLDKSPRRGAELPPAWGEAQGRLSDAARSGGLGVAEPQGLAV